MSTQPAVGGSVESGGFTVSSTHESSADMAAVLSDATVTSTEDAEPDPSKAASVLGRKGGEATAAKRAAEAKDAKREAKKQADEATDDPDGDVDGDGSELAPAATEKPLGKPRHDPTARVQQATREAKEAREEARAAREEAQRYRAELEASRKPATEERPRAVDPGAPKVEDFESYDEFVEAKIEHRLGRERAEVEQRRDAQAQGDRLHGKNMQFAGALAKAAGWTGELVGEEYRSAMREYSAQWSPEVRSLPVPTFNTEGNAGNWISNELAVNSEHAPALMLHLSEHPEVFQRLAALRSPRQVTWEMARLVTSVEAATTDASSKPTVSKARPPVKPVTGAPPTVGEPDPDASSYDEHKAFYNARDARKR